MATTRNFSKRSMSLTRKRSAHGLLYASPLILFVSLLFIAPLATVVRMSFSNWTLLGGDQGPAGIDNFVSAGSDPLLWPSVAFTLKYTLITTAILIPAALGLALMLQESRRWNSVIRTAILLPSALGLASTSLLFFGLYSPAIGPISPILESLSITGGPINFLGTPDSALASTIALVVWRFTGFTMLLLLIGLQAIPDEVYEAARIDGASRWQTFRSITFPLLRPSLALSLILTVTGSLLAFDQFFILTKGGPDNSTLTVVQVIYRTAFTKFDLGGAAALSIILLIALVAINITQLRVLRGRES